MATVPSDGESWRGAYHRMFVRHRDHLRLEVRTSTRPYLSDAKIDALAWRRAEGDIQRAIRMADAAAQRSKRNAGVAA